MEFLVVTMHCKNFFSFLGSFETLNQLGDCYPNPSPALACVQWGGDCAANIRSVFSSKNLLIMQSCTSELGLVVNLLIYTIVRTEFEDGFRTESSRWFSGVPMVYAQRGRP